MPFTLVIDEQTATGDEARVSKTSVCGSWGPITGELRYFADKFGNPRASIEGTQVPYDLLRQYRDRHGRRARLQCGQQAVAARAAPAREYHGFELEREIEPIEEFPPELAAARAARARRSARARRGAASRRSRATRTRSSRFARRIAARAAQTPRLGLAELDRAATRRSSRV